MLETTIAGSLPKPFWLAAPQQLWAPWRETGAALAEAKRDATLLALKEQEDCGIDIVTDGEQSRQHFVHGFLETIDGIDFAQAGEDGHSRQPLCRRMPDRGGAAHAPARGACRGSASSRARIRAAASRSPCPGR